MKDGSNNTSHSSSRPSEEELPPEGLVPIGRALRVKGKERGKGKLDRESRNSVAEFTCLSARGHYVLMRRVRIRMGNPN